MEGRKVAITVRDRHVDEERGGRVDWEHGLQEMGCASGCKWRVGVVGVERRRGRQCRHEREHVQWQQEDGMEESENW